MQIDSKNKNNNSVSEVEKEVNSYSINDILSMKAL